LKVRFLGWPMGEPNRTSLSRTAPRHSRRS
jgi:hypothetical protein